MRMDQGGVEQSGIANSGRVSGWRRAGAWGRCAAGLLVIAAGGSARSAADEIILAPVADNTMFHNLFNLDQALSSGVGDGIFAGRTSSQTASVIQRGLIRFDVSGIPCGATVTGVTLTLTLERGNSDAGPMELHRMSGAWGEGASNALGGSGAPSKAGDASWQHRVYPGTLWTNEGGDFAAAVSASTTVGLTPGPYGWSGAGLVADVNAWRAAPSTNFGWVLKGDELTLGSARKFVSREGFSVEGHPTLRVEYTPAVPVGISGQPADAQMCLSQGVSFTVGAAGAGQLTYLWQIENPDVAGGWENLNNGAYERYHVTIAGAGSTQLSVSPGTAGGSVDLDRTHVRCVVSDACGSVNSSAAELRLCRADINCDGIVDLSDYFDFFNCWDVSGPCSDLDGIPGVDLLDFFAFFNAWDQSC